MKLRLLVILVCHVFAFRSYGQTIPQRELDSICNSIKGLIGTDWFLTPTESGFKVTFCRSCHERYLAEENSGKYVLHYMIERDTFFRDELVDSVSFFPTVGLAPNSINSSDSVKRASAIAFYKANSILSFDVVFSQKWEESKYSEIRERNELLRKKILEKPIYKTSSNYFSDYRFWVPSNEFRDRTKEFSFYFERLPYTSNALKYSVFINPNRPCFFCEPMYIDKNDSVFYSKFENQIENEWERTMKTIAACLGIQDFKIVR